MSKMAQYVHGMQEDAYWMSLEQFTQKYGISNAVNWCNIRSYAELRYQQLQQERSE